MSLACDGMWEFQVDVLFSAIQAGLQELLLVGSLELLRLFFAGLPGVQADELLLVLSLALVGCAEVSWFNQRSSSSNNVSSSAFGGTASACLALLAGMSIAGPQVPAQSDGVESSCRYSHY